MKSGIIINLLLLTGSILFAQPVGLHPANPHYLIYKGKPVLLITSAEHYGSVINKDFDFITYLNTLKADGMNYTRIFSGSYVEIPGSFGILNNTLAPASGSFMAPWKRFPEPGLFNGEMKFDLNQWDTAYFNRLNRFIREASVRDIIVEVTFFCSTYQDDYWKRNPFNPGNNINGLPETGRKKSNTLANGPLTGYQKSLVKKIVRDLNGFDNLFYEIQNEPWSDDPRKAMRLLKTTEPAGEAWSYWSETASEASLEWQKEIAATIVETERTLAKKHLVAQNFVNFKHSLEEVDQNVSILNFHYAWPEAVSMNYGWNRVISFDESGFAGSSDTTYLRQAWQFILSGGGIFNSLDYSFYVGYETGNGKNKAPGGGSPALRKGLAILHDFLDSFDFISMKPDYTVVFQSPGLEWHAISETGKQYAICFSGKGSGVIKLDLPEGNYDYNFTDPFTGKPLSNGLIKSPGKTIEIKIPEFEQIAAMRIVAK